MFYNFKRRMERFVKIQAIQRINNHVIRILRTSGKKRSVLTRCVEQSALLHFELNKIAWLKTQQVGQRTARWRVSRMLSMTRRMTVTRMIVKWSNWMCMNRDRARLMIPCRMIVRTMSTWNIPKSILIQGRRQMDLHRNEETISAFR